MSEENKKPEVRTSQVIQQEYAQQCARAGNLQYELHAKSKDLEVLNNTLRDLNFEYVGALRSESEAAEAAKSSEKPNS